MLPFHPFEKIEKGIGVVIRYLLRSLNSQASLHTSPHLIFSPQGRRRSVRLSTTAAASAPHLFGFPPSATPLPLLRFPLLLADKLLTAKVALLCGSLQFRPCGSSSSCLWLSIATPRHRLKFKNRRLSNFSALIGSMPSLVLSSLIKTQPFSTQAQRSSSSDPSRRTNSHRHLCESPTSLSHHAPTSCFSLSRLSMGDRQVVEQQHTVDPQLPSPPATAKDDMVSCVMALEAALLPCLPARELQAIDRSPHPSHQIDVDRHARDFMEAAKKLQLYFISLQREDKPTKVEMLRKDIALMEEELNVKTELIKKQENLIQEWKKELKDQLDKHKTELERV